MQLSTTALRLTTNETRISVANLNSLRYCCVLPYKNIITNFKNFFKTFLTCYNFCFTFVLNFIFVSSGSLYVVAIGYSLNSNKFLLG